MLQRAISLGHYASRLMGIVPFDLKPDLDIWMNDDMFRARHRTFCSAYDVAGPET